MTDKPCSHLRLRENGDDVFIRPNGLPIVSWEPISQGRGSIYHQKIGAVLSVVHYSEDEHPLYDQPLLVMNPGAVIIPQTSNGCIGLIRIHRQTGKRIFPFTKSDYVARLQKEEQWQKLVASLGE